jgi:hypothetical protein
MKKIRVWGCLLALLGFLGSRAAVPASAKVMFTGYADLQVSPHAVTKLRGGQFLPAPLTLQDGRFEARTFRTDSLGLFAVTSLNEEIDFTFDVTYKKFGAVTDETRLQYAYIHYHPLSLWDVKAGRITLPIGLYNQNYFYPFQRHSVTPPLFQSAIIGLPIADHGVVAGKTIPLGPVDLSGAAFAVNGYGPTRTSTETFRQGLSGISGSLLIANNLRDANANNKFAYGGNVGASLRDLGLKAGVSSYKGAWSVDGHDHFSMLNAYLSLEAGSLSLLAEGLSTETDNDKGVTQLYGVRDWESTGGFLQASVWLLKREGRELALFAGSEETVAEGRGTGANGRERLIQHKGGVSWRMNPFALFKSQFSLLDYALPIQQSGGGHGLVGIKSKQFILSLVLTY